MLFDNEWTKSYDKHYMLAGCVYEVRDLDSRDRGVDSRDRGEAEAFEN